MHKLGGLINKLLHFSEELEEDMKVQGDLKGLTNRQLVCVEKIYELSNPTPSELSIQLHITKASMSVMLDRLEENKYIYKVKSDNDKRSAHIHLTKKGEKAAEMHTGLHMKIASILSKELTDSEKEILVVLLEKSMKSVKK